MKTSWIIVIFFFLAILSLMINVLGLQKRIKMFETAILACVNERPFIFKAENAKDDVVVMCKRV